MKFTNRQNKRHFVVENNRFFRFILSLFRKKRIVWESRSVAVNGCIIAFLPRQNIPYVLASKRGPKAADYQGKLNLIAGYLDWDETGTEALYRESWEEVGIDLESFAFPEGHADWREVIANDLLNPWQTKTEPDTSDNQNISLRYGFICKLKLGSELLELSLDHNEVDGEVSEAFWLPVNEIDKYEWAFNHDSVIRDYLARHDLLSHVFTSNK